MPTLSAYRHFSAPLISTFRILTRGFAAVSPSKELHSEIVVRKGRRVIPQPSLKIVGLLLFNSLISVLLVERFPFFAFETPNLFCGTPFDLFMLRLWIS